VGLLPSVKGELRRHVVPPLDLGGLFAVDAATDRCLGFEGRLAEFSLPASLFLIALPRVPTWR